MIQKEMVRCKNLLLSLLLLLAINTAAQETPLKKRLSFSFEPRYGFVIPHHDYMGYFVNEHADGFQLNLGLNTNGTKVWHKSYNYPQIGLGFLRSGLGNDAVYGNMNVLYFYVDRRYLSLSNRLNIGNRIAFGPAYMSKQFDLQSNRNNIAVGSPINVFVQYDLTGYYQVTPRTTIRLAVGFMHASNGSIREPNKGFNLITSGIGLQHSLTAHKSIIRNTPATPLDTSRSALSVAGIMGWKDISRFKHYLFPVYGITAEYSRRISETGWLGVVLSGYADQSIEEEFRVIGDTTFSSSKQFSAALNLSYEMRMGRLSFLFQPGFYLHHSFSPYGKVVNKLMLRYCVYNKLLFSMAIKSHWVAKADFIEFGIGYRLNAENLFSKKRIHE
ncbi:MAG: acyloxyacyl hydrolase [Bacteroidales bacterium]|nr:acyloxyacyl hydrolase [Bacteroidales bacterium]MBN2748281.1 acyloxyacyl hydrolase [Bacteroidales bacterium]